MHALIALASLLCIQTNLSSRIDVKTRDGGALGR